MAARRALAAPAGGGQSWKSVQVTGSQRLPVLGDRVLFLGGFFVLTFGANTGSAAEERLGWPSAQGCEGQPRGLWFEREVSIQLRASFGGQRAFLMRVTRW